MNNTYTLRDPLQNNPSECTYTS